MISTSFLPAGSRAARFGMVSALSLAAASGAVAGNLPTGFSSVSGGATASTSGSTLTVAQPGAFAVNSFSSFNIGSGYTVSFTGAGASLNRVGGAGSTNIAGSLTGTSGLSVYLINPNGILVSPSGSVNVDGRVVLSTLNVSDSDVQAGGVQTFTAGATARGVVNQGSITSTSGDVLLIGTSASNSGTITAANGHADLAAGSTVVLTPGSNPLVSVAGASGDVTNTGSISALNAALASSGGNVYALAGNTGTISATAVGGSGGQVYLTAGSGDVTVGGSVSGAAVTAQAGSDVTLQSGASLTSTSGGITLVAGDAFSNDNASSNPLHAATSYLIYSVAPANDTVGGIGYDFKQFGTSYPGAPAQAGDGFIYSTAGDVLTVTGLTGLVRKTYDGNTNALPYLTDANLVVTGGETGDVIDVSAGAASYATYHHGTNIPVTASNFTVVSVVDSTGHPIYGYTVGNASATGNVGEIDPFHITLTEVTAGVTKTYDGTTNLPSLRTYHFLVSGINLNPADHLSIDLSGATGSYTYADTNAYLAANGISQNNATINNIALAGNTNGDYVLDTTSVTAPGTITPKKISGAFVAGATVAKNFDGTNSATVDASEFTLNGLVLTDAGLVQLNVPTTANYNIIGSSRYTQSGIGVVVTGASISGAKSLDYALSSTRILGLVGVICASGSPTCP